MTDVTELTPEEIKKYREQLANNPQAIAQMDIIERCEGDLEQAARILARRAKIKDVRAKITWESALKQARQVVCQEKFQDGLAPDLISGVVSALLTAGNPLLIAVATPCASYIIKVSLAKFCQHEEPDTSD